MSAPITDKTLLALINLIYEAACDPEERWSEFLRRLACAVGSRGTLIYTHRLETMSASTASQAGFYAGWLRPQGYFRDLGGIVVRDGAWAMKCSSLHRRGAGDFNPEELRLHQALLPHLARAAKIQRRLAFLQSLSDSSLAVLDTVPAAVVLLNGSGRALHGNASAEAELRRADPLRLGPSREICVRGGSGAQASVRTAIAAALDPARSVAERLSTVAQVRRRNGEMLSVQTLPLPQASRARYVTTTGREFAACALVIHGAATGIPTVGLQLLRHIYGLTPAEVKVALAIAEGETIKRYAERRRISRNTAASQLKSAFDKTGLRRQSELVRWLLQGGATLRPGAAATGARLHGRPG